MYTENNTCVKTRLFRNALANYFSTGVASIAPLLAIPYYLDNLGPTNWGIVSFVGLLVSVLSIFDAGISQALVKEFAEPLDTTCQPACRNADLLFGYEIVYGLFAGIAAILTVLCADLIRDHWLTANNLPETTGNLVILTAAILLTAQLPGSIYRSALTGLQEQVALNKLITFFTIIRHGIALLLVKQLPDIAYYLTWQCLCSALETLTRGALTWRTIGFSHRDARWRQREMLATLKFSLAMSASVIASMILLSVDKLFLSILLPLEQLGYYGIASSVAFAVLRLFHPLHIAVQPHLVEMKHSESIRQINLALFRITLLFIAAIGIGFALFGTAILQWWLTDRQTVDAVYPILCVLLVGSALNGLYNIGYINWVATAQTRKILQVNIISLAICLIATPLAIKHAGTMGAGIAWLVANVTGLFFSLEWLKKTKHA